MILRMTRFWLAVVFASALSMTAQAVKLDADLVRRAHAGEELNLIVEYDSSAIEVVLATRRDRMPRGIADQSGLADMATRYRQLKSDADRASSPTEIETVLDYSHLPMRLQRVRSPAALAALAAHPNVRALYRNTAVRRVLAQSLPLIAVPAMAAVGYGGAGTTVAVIDDGIDLAHPAFGGCTAVGVPSSCRIAAVQTFVASPGTDFSHGTNVSGIVAGVAPQASIAMLNVFSASGASSADVIAAINWAIANRTAFNIAAINMSLGDGSSNNAACSTGNAFARPVANARAAGISVVAAAGNAAVVNGSFVPGISAPACTPGVISVGAVYDANLGGLAWGGLPNQCVDASTQTGQIACFSQSAPILTLLAPGAVITAAGITEGGTSQAAPHAAGAVAVLRAAFPDDTLAATLGRLTSSSVQVTDPRNGVTRPLLALADAARPSNDRFANRTTLAGSSGTVSGLTLLATREPGEPQHAAAGTGSVWWTWTAPASGQVTLGTAGSDFDTLLAVYTGTAVGTLAPVASNNNAPLLTTSALHFQAQAGSTYQWAVDGAGGGGHVALQWSLNSAASADLSAALSGPSDARSGETIVYTAQVGNAGPEAATGVRLTLNLPAGVSYASGPAACSLTGTVVVCRASELASNSSASWTLQFTVTDPGGGLTFSESVSSDLPDPSATNNASWLTTLAAAQDGDVPALPPWAMAALTLLLSTLMARRAT